MHRTSREVNNHLEEDHRGIKSWYRSMRGCTQGNTAVRLCRTCDEVRAWLHPQLRCHQSFSRASRRCSQQDWLPQLIKMLVAA